jgi:hypothetical protein
MRKICAGSSDKMPHFSSTLSSSFWSTYLAQFFCSDISHSTVFCAGPTPLVQSLSALLSTNHVASAHLGENCMARGIPPM